MGTDNFIAGSLGAANNNQRLLRAAVPIIKNRTGWPAGTEAEHGLAMPYDAERVMQLRGMLREARKQKLSAGLRERLEKGRR